MTLLSIPPQTVQWLLNNDYLPPNSDENIRFPQRGHDELNCLNRLVLENVTEAYEGIYECRLANTLPSVPAQRELDLACEILGKVGIGEERRGKALLLCSHVTDTCPLSSAWSTSGGSHTLQPGWPCTRAASTTGVPARRCYTTRPQ